MVPKIWWLSHFVHSFSEKVVDGMLMLFNILIVVICVPSLFFSIQLFAACFYKGGEAPKDFSNEKLVGDKVSILIPAHNEATMIEATLSSVLPQFENPSSVIVVADNCTDNTAELARSKGATVLERFDEENRGKAFAIEHGVAHLAQEVPPDCVIIVDADCDVSPGSFNLLAKKCSETNRPVQARYLIKRASTRNDIAARLAEFAFLVKNLVRPLGLQSLGLPTQLQGSGMAFRWAMIHAQKATEHHLVEDLLWGVSLASQGHSPLYCPEAKVTSFFPESKNAEATQRQRWEHGYLDILVHETPRLFGKGLVKGNVGLLGLALDLAIPPLSLMIVVLVALLLVSALIGVILKSAFGFMIILLSLISIGASIIAAWKKFGQQILRPSDFAGIPEYIVGKLPLYARFFGARQKEWVRTERDDNADAS